MIETMFCAFVALMAWWFLPWLLPSVRARYRAEAEQEQKQLEAWNAEFGPAGEWMKQCPHCIFRLPTSRNVHN
jgi:hypothetical protein